MLRLNTVVSAFVAAAIGLVAACSGAAPALLTNNQAAETGPTPRTISVAGSGLAYAKPDIANVSLGVRTHHDNASTALSDNNTQTGSLNDFLRGLGIEEKDLQTTNFSVYAQQDYDTNGNPTGRTTYYVDNTVNVTVRDLNKLGDLLSQAVENGANHVYGISFSVSDPTVLEAEARKLAVQNARDHADQLALAAGVSVDTVLSISEYSAGAPIVYDTRMALDAAPAAGGMAPVPVSQGQIQVSVQVNIVYTIK